jgi:ABC-type multidrug transport system ATPase subunit
MEIKAQHLSKRFSREWIFKDFEYTFSAGNTYAITGPNGSGKSTLLQVLWGQVPPTSGHLAYSTSGNQIAIEEVYQHISIATPYMDLVDELTLLEHLQFHFRMKKSRDGMGVKKIIELMQLETAADKLLINFSSGMKQRVKLGMAFFTASNIVFLDEPGTNLDKPGFEWFLTNLNALPADTMIFIASNQPAEYPEKAHKIDVLRYK